MDEEYFFIEPNNSLPITALYDLCWRTWFECFDNEDKEI